MNKDITPSKSAAKKQQGQLEKDGQSFVEKDDIEFGYHNLSHKRKLARVSLQAKRHSRLVTRALLSRVELLMASILDKFEHLNRT